jgi:D-alanyl-D-alanine carboxypeptidase
LGIGLALVFFPQAVKDSASKPAISGLAVKTETVQKKPGPEIALNVNPPVLTAHAAIAYDMYSGAILYSKNLDQKLPIASLTKLVTALTVLHNQDLTSVVKITKADRGVVGSTMGLAAGETITADSLLYAMLISSSNDAAVALSVFIAGSQQKFAAMMNAEAESLGLTATHFSNPVGWDSDDNYSNTLDLIKITQEFLKHDELRQIAKTEEMTVVSTDGKYIHKLRTTNKLLLENPEVQGIKTGFTSKALGNLIILDNHNGNEIVTVVLGSNNREEDTQKLLDWVFEVYRW